MPAPKEVMTARVAANTKSKLSKKADQMLIPLSSYVGTVLDSHVDLISQEIIELSYEPSEFGNIILFFQNKLKNTHHKTTSNIAILESKPLDWAHTQPLTDSVLIPILPITRITRRYCFTRSQAQSQKRYIYYDPIDYSWISKLKTTTSKASKSEGYASFKDAFKKFIKSNDTVLVCGPLVASFLSNSSEFKEVKPLESQHIESALTNYLKVPFGDTILESDMKQARELWEKEANTFIARLDLSQESHIEDIKHYCQYTLPDIEETLGKISNDIIKIYCDFIGSNDVIFPSQERISTYFGDKNQLTHAIHQWL